MRIKVVKNDSPNDEGEWIEVHGNPPQVRGWCEMAELLDRFVPAGHHIVAVDGDHRSMWRDK